MAAAIRGATTPHAPRAYGRAAVSTSARRSMGACAATSNNASRVGGGYSSYTHGRRRSSDVVGEKQSHGALSTSDFTVAASRSISRGRRGGYTFTSIAAVINPMSETHGTDDHATATAEKVGILLLNLGGPEKLADVQPFLYNLFADPDIIRLPAALQFLQSPLAALLSNSRAPKSREAYESIGGGSPLRRITDEQAAALKEALARKGQDAEVYVGMRYWKPFTEDAVQQIKADGITRLVVLPLYPQFSISTSGSSLRLLEQLFSEDEYLQQVMGHTVIPSWYQRPGYVQAMAELIKQELNKPGSQFDSPDEPIIFFSAHGVPVSYVETAGDPYREEMEECVDLIVARLKKMGVNNEHILAYQSRVGPVEWLKPYTDDVIRDLGAKGTKAMVAVPISFVSEHIETLEEIDMEYRELAEESGVKQWGRVPALDTNPIFIQDLADAVVESLQTFETPRDDDDAAGAAAVFNMMGSGDFGTGKLQRGGGGGGVGALPPISIMPMGTGTKTSVPSASNVSDLGDLLGVKPDPWEWGPVEFAMVALSVLISTMLIMDLGM